MPKDLAPTPETHFMPASPKCPICGSSANVYRRRDASNLIEGHCQICSDVAITLAAVEKAQNTGKAHLISAWLRRQPPGYEPGIIDVRDLERIFSADPTYSVLEKLDLALIQIAAKTEQPGQMSTFQVSADFPLIYAKNLTEAIFYVRELYGMGYINNVANPMVTAAGYKHLSEIQQSGRQSDQAFVAMWFTAETNLLYDEAIAPAVRDAGYRPFRVDRHEHVNRIDDEIIAQLRRSRFMVGDFTGQRQGVYYEAGFMGGLGRRVIWMCPKQELHQVHFDTRQYSFIVYEDLAGASKGLYNRILAVEGEGPNATPEDSKKHKAGV